MPLSQAGAVAAPGAPVNVRCGIGSWGGQCLSMGDYVMVTRPTDGATAAPPPEGVNVDYAPVGAVEPPSVKLIRQAVERMPAGPLATPLPPLPAFAPAFSVVEGWRGAIVHWLMADAAGRLFRVKIMDPSFLNWRPLSLALIDNIVPDFPLCNKSFNQSYSGNDL